MLPLCEEIFRKLFEPSAKAKTASGRRCQTVIDSIRDQNQLTDDCVSRRVLHGGVTFYEKHRLELKQVVRLGEITGRHSAHL